MCRLDDLMMTDKVQEKWRKLPLDIKIALRIAFWQALSNPLYTAYYEEWTIENLDDTFIIQRFRIGYAIFVLGKFESFPEYIICDLDFREGDNAFVGDQHVTA
jgi:hypothetical protein